MENKMLAWKLREISRGTGSVYKKQLFRKAARRIEEQAQLLEKAQELLMRLEKALPRMDADCSFCDYGKIERPCYRLEDFPECAECPYDCFCKECTAKGSAWTNSMIREVIEGVSKVNPSVGYAECEKETTVGESPYSTEVNKSEKKE